MTAHTLLLSATLFVASAHAANNFFEVDAGKFYRSAQMSGKDIEKVIRSHGIRTIINLRGSDTDEKWYREEVAASARNGVQLVDIPMEGSRIPHREDLMRLLDAYRDAPRPILVHCRRGADRTGEAVAMYLMDYMGKTRDTALEALSLKYGHWELFKPAKRYFIEKVYEGKEWAQRSYFPCQASYKYYDKKKYCTKN